MTAFLTDILAGLVEQGFDKIFVLNADDGNIGAARLAISQVTHEHSQAAILLVNWWETLPGPLVDSLHLFDQPNGGHGHGGPLELSVAAAFAPDAVVTGKGPDRPPPESFSEGFPYYLEKSHAKDWPGYSGKLSEISPEKGERLVQIAEERLEKLAETWLANPTDPGSW
jgi:creatinine amidohydrolase/Fe(II)-dependent formamide hydrolase-like protein